MTVWSLIALSRSKARGLSLSLFYFNNTMQDKLSVTLSFKDETKLPEGLT